MILGSHYDLDSLLFAQTSDTDIPKFLFGFTGELYFFLSMTVLDLTSLVSQYMDNVWWCFYPPTDTQAHTYYIHYMHYIHIYIHITYVYKSIHTCRHTYLYTMNRTSQRKLHHNINQNGINIYITACPR